MSSAKRDNAFRRLVAEADGDVIATGANERNAAWERRRAPRAGSRRGSSTWPAETADPSSRSTWTTCSRCKRNRLGGRILEIQGGRLG